MLEGSSPLSDGPCWLLDLFHTQDPSNSILPSFYRHSPSSILILWKLDFFFAKLTRHLLFTYLFKF